MRRSCGVFAFLALQVFAVYGCSQGTPAANTPVQPGAVAANPAKTDHVAPAPVNVAAVQTPSNPPANSNQPPVDPPVNPPPQPAPKPMDPTPPAPLPANLAGDLINLTGAYSPTAEQEKYDAALAEAFGLMADRKWAQALVSLENARAAQDNEFVRGEIEKLRKRLDQENDAQTTVASIERILEQGKAKEASQLATKALQEFGDRDGGHQLVKLRLQAEALQTVQNQEDARTRSSRLRDEGEQAFRDKNLRAAAIAFEQALNAQPDAILEQKLKGIQEQLTKYDDLRKKASELRQDPNQLEDALEMLKQASQAWDTLQVQQEIDEYTIALKNRRDTLSVVDLETRGDVGLPMAGRSLAEELMPHFKSRFDLVERGQIQQLVDELKLENNLSQNLEGQREIGKLAKVKYLVLGSVSRLGGVTVQARLVEVRTGLLVQTGKVTAPTIEDAFAVLPELAKQLMMSDEQKMAYDQEKIQLTKKPPVVQENEPLPLPPEAPPMGNFQVADALLAPPPPPDFGKLQLNMFDNLPPPPPPGQILPAVPQQVVQVDFQGKRRLLNVTLQFGDFLFRAGRFRDAHRHFEFALQLAPGDADVMVRLDRCRPFIPPPVVVVDPVIVIRPRVAILNFLVVGDPRIVPPMLSSYTPQHLEPYLRRHFDIVDPLEINYFMARMGMTVYDLMYDLNARRWLGRALHARYFLMGTVQQTASFDVSTYLLDAEFGHLQGQGRVHARNPFELKFRLADLAEQTMMPPGQRVVFLQEVNQFQLAMKRGRDLMARQNIGAAADAFRDALRMRPHSVEARVELNRAIQLQNEIAWREQQRQRMLAQAAAMEAARRRQMEMARFAELERQRVLAVAIQRNDVEIRLQFEKRARAQLVLVEEARLAFKTKNFAFSISRLESAIQMYPAQPIAQPVAIPVAVPTQDELVAELAFARREMEKEKRLRATEVALAREEGLRKVREEQIRSAQNQLLTERNFAKISEEKARKEREERDLAAYNASVREGQRLLSLNNFDGAIASFQAAQRIKQTPLVENQLDVAYQRRAEASAKTEGERKIVEAKLNAERNRRIQAETEAKANEKAYKAALALAQEALAAKRFDEAHAKFEEAGRFYKTDIVLVGLQKADQGKTQLSAANKKATAEAQRDAQVRKYITEGNAALADKNFSVAITAYRNAKRLDPDQLEAITGLTRAEQGRDRALAEARRNADETDRKKTFQRFIDAGRESLAKKNYEAASLSLTEAVKLNPSDAAALQLLKTAEQGKAQLAADAKTQAAAKQRAVDYQKLIAEGRASLASKRYDDAIKAFAGAQKVMPGDAAAAALITDAQTAKSASQSALQVEAKRLAEEKKKAADLDAALTQGRIALQKKDFAAASLAFEKAKTLDPRNADVLKGLRDLDQAKESVNAAEVARKARQAKFDSAMQEGKNALTTKKYADAVKAFGDALKIEPTNTVALTNLRQAQQLLESGKTPPRPMLPEIAAEKQFQEKLKTAQDLASRGKYAEALPLFQQAVKLNPTSKDASDGAKTAEFNVNIQDGNRFFESKQYQSALKEYNEALKIFPFSPIAKQLRDRAQLALTTPQPEPKKTAPMPEPKKTAPFPMPEPKKTPPLPKIGGADDKFQEDLQKGLALQKQGKFAESLPYFQAAARAKPNDKTAADGVKIAEFNVNMQDGNRHFESRRYVEALREYEEALRLFPFSPIAKAARDKAKKAAEKK